MEDPIAIRIELAVEDGALLVVNLPGDPLVEIEPLDMDHVPAVVEGHGKLRVDNEEFPFFGSYSTGSQYWRGYAMPLPVAVKFLCRLHRRGRFDCTQAETEFFERWRGCDPLTEDFVEQYLMRRYGEDTR